MRTKLLILLLLSFLTHSVCRDTHAEESHPGLGVEALYTAALLEYNKQNIKEAEKILDQVLKRDPKYIPALEMRALTLKVNGDDVKAIEIYKRLLVVKPKAEHAPYHFELATIYNKHKYINKTKYHLSKCVEMKFNLTPVNLLLGTLAFNDGNYADAETSFTYVKKNAPPELTLIAHYYLGLINFRMGYGAIGTSEILEARSIGKNLSDNKSTEGILAATDKILEPFQKSRWFLNATAVGQYDSNVAQIPLGISNPNQLSGKTTPKLNLSGGFGWMGAPLSFVQPVISYRAGVNKNFNSNTRTLEFFTNTLSLYANIRPLSAIGGGFKVDGNFIFQNQADSGGSYVFQKSSMSAETGPFLKLLIKKTIQIQTDFYYRKQTSFLFPTQDGYALGMRGSIRATTVKLLFNPGINFSTEKADAIGADYRYQAYGFGLTNSMRLTSLDTVNLSADLLSTNYFDSATGRADLNLTPRLNWAHMLTPSTYIMVDLSYVINSSTVSDSYSYNRYTTGFGIGWSM